MPTDLWFTDPDGDGVGGWGTDPSTTLGDLATRAWVAGYIQGALDSPDLTGIPTARTAAPGTSNEQISTTEYVDTAVTIAEAQSQEFVNEAVAASQPALQATVDASLAALTTQVETLETDLQEAIDAGLVMPDNGTAGLALFACETVDEVKTYLGLNNVANVSPANMGISDATALELADRVTATQLAEQAALLIPRNLINAPNGVAGLNANAEIPPDRMDGTVLICAMQNRTTGAYPGRPITTADQPVVWVGDEPPPGGGTVSGGAGMVLGLDIVLYGGL